MLHPIQLRSIIRADTTQVNEPNIPYRFENIFQYHYGILQKSNIENGTISLKNILLFSLNLNISKFSISQLKKTSVERIYRIYRILIQNIVMVLKFQHLTAQSLTNRPRCSCVLPCKVMTTSKEYKDSNKELTPLNDSSVGIKYV